MLEQALWHISDQLKLPEGLNLYFLLPTDLELNSRSQAAVPSAPAYSPELQPAERLWPLTNEVVANESPQSIEELEELLMFRCQKLLEQQHLVKGLTCYHWWPVTRAA